MTETTRGSLAVVIVTAVVVAAMVAIRMLGADWPDFLLGFCVALPAGALLGFLTDRALQWAVDHYLDHLRGR